MRALAGGPLGAHAREVAANSLTAAMLVGAGRRVGAGEAQDRSRQSGTGCPRPPRVSAVRRGGAQRYRPGGLSRRSGTRRSPRRRSVAVSALALASHIRLGCWHRRTRRFFPAGPGGLARGATGTRAPLGDPGAGLPPAPADPAGPAREPSWWGLSGTLGGVPWAALRRPRCGDFCLATLFGLPLRPIAGASRLPCSQLAADNSPPLLALPRQRVSRASWISALQHEGLPSRRRSLPRWVLDPSAPSQAATRALCARFR